MSFLQNICNDSYLQLEYHNIRLIYGYICSSIAGPKNLRFFPATGLTCPACEVSSSFISMTSELPVAVLASLQTLLLRLPSVVEAVETVAFRSEAVDSKARKMKAVEALAAASIGR